MAETKQPAPAAPKEEYTIFIRSASDRTKQEVLEAYLWEVFCREQAAEEEAP